MSASAQTKQRKLPGCWRNSCACLRLHRTEKEEEDDDDDDDGDGDGDGDDDHDDDHDDDDDDDDVILLFHRFEETLESSNSICLMVHETKNNHANIFTSPESCMNTKSQEPSK